MSDEKTVKETVPPEEGVSRRQLLVRSIAGAAAAGAAGFGAYAHHKTKGTPHDEMPVGIEDDLQPMDQRDMLWTFVVSSALNEAHPERTEAFDGFNFHEKLTTTYMKGPYKDVPGYTQIDRALSVAAWEGNTFLAPGQQYGQPNSGILHWDQSDVNATKYEFDSKDEATLAIRSAARALKATRCGITQRDPRWDFDPLYDLENDGTLSWEDDFPFEPKTVIVMLTEMDYEGIGTSPAWTSTVPAGEEYVMGDKCAGQMAKFLRGLGYQAVGSNNDLGMNVPYAVAAGLGEAGRNGSLIAPMIGPRHRICKVYTDFEFVNYDKPRSFGVASFCKECMRCADSCPSEAISKEKQPTWGPEYEGADIPHYTYPNRAGILKYHNDSKKCLKFWIENDGGCQNCIAACPYNKPEFWHHRLVDATNVVVPGPVHAFMREMDIIFGYGTTFDQKRARAFWKSGKAMRGG
jgi:reductive dehalogenase